MTATSLAIYTVFQFGLGVVAGVVLMWERVRDEMSRNIALRKSDFLHENEIFHANQAIKQLSAKILAMTPKRKHNGQFSKK